MTNCKGIDRDRNIKNSEFKSLQTSQVLAEMNQYVIFLKWESI